MEMASIHITLFHMKGIIITCYSIYNTKNLTGTRQKVILNQVLYKMKLSLPFLETNKLHAIAYILPKTKVVPYE